MSRDSDLSKIIKNAQVQGFKYSRTSTGHHQFYAPNGHDIITFSGTPSDGRSDLNSMAALKRAGYMELQTLGDAMPEKKEEEVPVKKVKLSVAKHLADLLSRHPEGMSKENIQAYIKSVRPDVTDASYYEATRSLINKGLAKRLPSGHIQLIGNADKVKKPIKAEVPVLRGKSVSVDKDLKALDAAMNKALTALTEIDHIAHRLKEELSDYAMIKEMFSKRPKK
jgi:hypothetical protein